MSDDRKKHIDDDGADIDKEHRQLPQEWPDHGDSAEEFIDFDRPIPPEPGRDGNGGGEGGMGGRE